MSNPSVDLSLIDISEVTSGKLTGNGSFDILMQAITAHLDHQFKQQRITGSDYAQAYVQLTSAALQSAVQFTVQIKETAAQEALLKAQTLAVLWDARIKETQVVLTEAEIRNTEQQTLLTKQKYISEVAQTDPTPIKEGSVLWTQNALMNKQKDGFDRDAEQKAVNTLFDVLKVRVSTDAAEGGEIDGAGATSANHKKAIYALLNRAGFTEQFQLDSNGQPVG